MQLATSDGVDPWICTVWFTSDDDLNIYWFSAENRNHSQQISKNPRVAVAITIPQSPEEPSRGIQVKGKAEILTEQKDIERTISIYKDRIFPIEKIESLLAKPGAEHKFYKLTPETIILLDAKNFPDQPRQELKL